MGGGWWVVGGRRWAVGGGCGLACASSLRSVAAGSSCSCTTTLLRTALARAAKRSVLCVSSE
eukprot:scaffold126272_cov63-Phaeocystis_antarctica.AAC.1